MKDKNKIVSIRLDDDTFRKIENDKQQFGLNTSEAIRYYINQDEDVRVIDGTKIAAALHEIRLLLLKNEYEEEMKSMITDIISELYEEIYKLFSHESN